MPSVIGTLILRWLKSTNGARLTDRVTISRDHPLSPVRPAVKIRPSPPRHARCRIVRPRDMVVSDGRSAADRPRPPRVLAESSRDPRRPDTISGRVGSGQRSWGERGGDVGKWGRGRCDMSVGDGGLASVMMTEETVETVARRNGAGGRRAEPTRPAQHPGPPRWQLRSCAVMQSPRRWAGSSALDRISLGKAAF